MQVEIAEGIAIRGLQYIAGDPQELSRFFSLTGYSVEEMREQSRTGELNIAVLEFFVNHEPGLLAFAASCGFKPQDVVKAWQVLGGSNECLDFGG